jgi:uncharacterized protein (DUF58 family)
MSRAGSTIRLGIAFVLVGAAFDLPSLHVPGIALLALAAGAFAWIELAARGATIAVVPGPRTVVEGQPYPIAVTVTAGELPLRGQLQHPLLERTLPIGISLPRRAEQVRIDASFERRGRRSLEPPVSLLIADPLRLHERKVTGDDAPEVLVLPRVEPVIAAGHATGGRGEDLLDGLGRGGGGAGLDANPIDAEIDGLRPYREGSAASRIHWPAVARSGELLERRLVAGDSEKPLIVLDAAEPESEEALDRAVRAAASLCVHLARVGGCGLLLGGDRLALTIDPQLRSWPRAHARLALVEAGAKAPPTARTATGTVFWVTAAAPATGLARGGWGRGGCLVTATAMPGVPTLFEVAGCHGHALRTLAPRVRERSAA